MQAMCKMQEGLTLLACVSSDRTRLHGCVTMTDIISYMTTHWNGSDVDCFKIPLKQLDMLFENELVKCKESDILFVAIRKMRDFRVNTVAVEADDGCYTVGLCFLNDILFLLG
jgi:CBS domain-containing protein